MKSTEEHKIIAGCQARNAFYQKELVKRYSGKLMAICRRYARDDASAKDILQEGLIKVLKDIDQYQGKGSFEGWIKKIVINTALQQRSRKRFTYEIYSYENLPEGKILPEVYSQLSVEELIAIINQLPEGFRVIFNLYVIEGYSHEEIAQMLAITPSTSRSQLARARKILQKKIILPSKIRI